MARQRSGGATAVQHGVTDAHSYLRLRTFLESQDALDRRLTAEWLAGRLSVPIRTCTAHLEVLVSQGVIQRHTRPDGPPWFHVVPSSPANGLRRLLLGLVVITLSAGVVVAGAMLHHMFFFALGLGLGLMIAFAWLDWELRSRL